MRFEPNYLYIFHKKKNKKKKVHHVNEPYLEVC